MILDLIGAGVLCAGIAAGLSAAARALLAANGILDKPNERSSHREPVVRGAGIGMSATWVIVAIAATLLVGRSDGAIELIAMAGCLSILGLVDDVRPLSPAFRAGVELLICAVAMAAGLAPEAVTLPGGLTLHLGGAAIPLWTIWTVLTINLFNFMDGIDGLAASQTVVSGAVIGVIAVAMHLTLLSVLGIALAGVAAGFLPLNWNPARCFMGDSGSYFCGSALVGLWLLGQKEGVSILVMGLPATAFFLDAVATLAVRTLRRQPPWRAHRSHLYQRLVARGRGQAEIALSYTIVSVGLAALDVSLYVR
jgi:UDP-GlcNAc:undecaprenyl-phosphate GlcNAc-1-phosphate transferase